MKWKLGRDINRNKYIYIYIFGYIYIYIYTRQDLFANCSQGMKEWKEE